jgi:hypothetical protein
MSERQPSDKLTLIIKSDRERASRTAPDNTAAIARLQTHAKQMVRRKGEQGPVLTTTVDKLP